MLNLILGETAPATRSASDSNAFGFKLHKVLSVMPGNYVMSPYSLHRVLSLAEEGAAGETAQQMSALLHLEGKPNSDEGVKALLDSLRESAKSSQIAFQSTNHLWYRRGIGMEQSFISKAKTNYGVTPEELDFTNPGKACTMMNQAILVATRGRIKELVSSDAIQKNTSLVLANTVYLMGAWSSRFEPLRTKLRPFWVAEEKKIREVPTMLQTSSMSYMHGDGFALLEMPISGDFSMVFLLPDERDGLVALESSLTLSLFETAMKQLSSYEVTVLLPKFSFSMGGDFKPMIEALGARRMWVDGSADFPRISLQTPVRVSTLCHETTIEVNEVGAEATAATMMPADPFADTSPRVHEMDKVRRVVFNADHPFLFALRHSQSGLLLIMGRVNRP